MSEENNFSIVAFTERSFDAGSHLVNKSSDQQTAATKARAATSTTV